MKKTVILLINLGSPDTLTVSAISRFLRKFLSDRRVVNLPKLLWYPILYLIILPFRSQKLLVKYRVIWQTEKGCSPLVHYTNLQAIGLKERFSSNPEIIVDHAFCYSNPDIHMVLSKIQALEVKKIIILPLYPQFSSTTTMAVFDSIAEFYANKFDVPDLSFIRGFAIDQSYIKAIVQSIQESFVKNGKPDKLILSYHSLPKSVIEAGDSYYAECLATSREIIQHLGLSSSDYVVSFQSKFGRQKWLSPVTSTVIKDLAVAQNMHIAVVCPGFISDCLETLEEINLMNRAIFLKHGGKKYQYIPCLNASIECIDMLYKISNL